MPNRERVWLFAFLVVVFCAWSAPDSVAAAQNQETSGKSKEPSPRDWQLLFPEGEGKSYVLALCQGCHTLKGVALQRNDESGWRGVLYDMSSRGANLYDEDISIMAQYLAEHFGPQQPPLEIPLDLNQASAEQISLLPEFTKEKATQVVEARQKKAFQSLADLKEVLSDEEITKIKPFVVVR